MRLNPLDSEKKNQGVRKSKAETLAEIRVFFSAGSDMVKTRTLRGYRDREAVSCEAKELTKTGQGLKNLECFLSCT